MIGASFNFFVSFFDESIKKIQRLMQFYFLGKLNVNVCIAKIANKYINGGGISKSSKTYQCFWESSEKQASAPFLCGSYKELWPPQPFAALNCTTYPWSKNR